MDQIFDQLRNLIQAARALDRKDAYLWAVVRYAQAAMMGQTLEAMQMTGATSMTADEIAILNRLMNEVRADALSLKVGNGHKMSGKKTEPGLGSILATLIGELDAVFGA